MQITAWGAWPSARTLLLNDAPMSMLTVSIPAARSDPSWSKNASRVAVSLLDVVVDFRCLQRGRREHYTNG